MEKIKKVLISILSILSEYITLFSTIVASTYILITSQYVEYKIDSLILWIISLLGLIAISIAAEKFFKLRKIENCVEEINNSQKNKTVSIDQLFFSRKNLSPLEERFKNAVNIVITGGSLARLSDEYYGFFEQKLSSGCKLEVVLVDPNSEASKQLCINTVYETTNIDAYRRKIDESINRFKELKQLYPDLVTILLSDQTPPFSMLAKNIGCPDSFVQVELYSYAVPTRERIEFVVNEDDTNTYQFFCNQIKTIEQKARTYEE